MADDDVPQPAEEAPPPVESTPAPEPPSPESTPAPEGETPAPEGEAAEAPQEPKPNPKIEARMRHLTRAANDAKREAEEHRLRAEAAEQVLAQLRAGNGQEQPQQAANGQYQAAVQAEANRLIAEQRANEERGALIAAGVKDYTAETWNEKTAMLATMGALQRPEFMETLLSIPDGHRLAVALADDPDELANLLGKRPAQMAAMMGRMAAELSVADEPKKPVSRAPAPVKPVGTGRVAPQPDPGKMTSAEYIAWRNRTAPKHLGGRGEAH